MENVIVPQIIKVHIEDSMCSKMRRGVEIGRRVYRESGALFSIDESVFCCNNPKFGGHNEQWKSKFIRELK